MKVKELITALARFDTDADVVGYLEGESDVTYFDVWGAEQINSTPVQRGDGSYIFKYCNSAGGELGRPIVFIELSTPLY